MQEMSLPLQLSVILGICVYKVFCCKHPIVFIVATPLQAFLLVSYHKFNKNI